MHRDRYTVPSEEDFEPGSNNQVLKNWLGIQDRSAIEMLEASELERTGNQITELYDENHKFSALDICDIHELWLANIYPFAGRYRTVMMSKDGFPFASPQFIDQTMSYLENQYLKTMTPCKFRDEEQLAYELGVVHVELIIIHPFREGNGRVARLLANLMAMQAGKKILNYLPIDKTVNPNGYTKYISGIHKGVIGDYELIKNVFVEILNASQL